MNSILKLRESDPHDVFSIVPETVPATWADKVVADITGDAGSDPTRPARLARSLVRNPASVQPPPAKPGAAAGAPAPVVDTTFRATAADIRMPDIDITHDRPVAPPPTGRLKSIIIAFMFALCSAVAAAGWQHYGVAARQMIAGWMPPFALTSLQPTEPTGLAGKPDTPDVPAPTPTAASPQEQAPPQPASVPTTDGAASAAAPSAEAQLQSMARDLAAMGQQIELLKATIAELKAGQQTAQPSLARDAAKTSEVKPSPPNPRPRATAPLPPRPVAASPRRPMQAYPTQGYAAQGYPAQVYPPAQAAAPPPLQQFPPPASRQAAPAVPMAAELEDGETVVRPPMPLH